MKKLLIIFCLLGLVLFATAQSTIKVNEQVSISANFDLNFILSAHLDKNKNCDLGEGYRIQIMNSSSREEVYSKKAEVYSSFSDFKAYIVYDQPYYKLRIGDFVSKMEARKYLDEIIAVFPTAFLVKDEIKIK